MGKTRLNTLKGLSAMQCRQLYEQEKLTPFECRFNGYLSGEIGWPCYTGKDIVQLRERLHMTQEALALLLHVSVKTIGRWEAGDVQMPPSVNIALLMIDSLDAGIFDLMQARGRQFELKPLQKGKRTLVQEGLADVVVADVSEQKRPLPEVFDAQVVRDLRERLHLTRREFAQRLGVSVSSVDKWENAEVTPQGSALTLLKILWQQGESALPD